MRLFSRLTRPQPGSAAVLMYHRIADVAIDPWELAVSPANFEKQLRLLKKKHTVISVDELLPLIHKNKVPPRCICITFDDGYTDNYTVAKPLLEKYNLPASFFIPTCYTGADGPFWWDDLGTLFLKTPQLPQLFQMSIAGSNFQFDLGSDAYLTKELLQKHRTWIWTQPAPTQRCALYLKIWKQLQPLPFAEIQTTMAAIRYWAGQTWPFEKDSVPMHEAQLADLSRNPLFQLGMHTATHPALAYHPKEIQHQEIAENKKALQKYQPVNAIAFPYGNFNNDTLLTLQELGITAGFTTQEHLTSASANLYCLGRFQVKNRDANAF